MNSSLYRDLVRAIANGDSAEARRLDGQLSPEARREYQTFVTLFFGGVLAEWFADDHRHDEVIKFVDYMSHAYRHHEQPVDKVALELLVRAFLGEEELFERVSAAQQMHLQILGIRAITDRISKVKENFEAYLNDTEMAMDELAQED